MWLTDEVGRTVRQTVGRYTLSYACFVRWNCLPHIACRQFCWVCFQTCAIAVYMLNEANYSLNSLINRRLMPDYCGVVFSSCCYLYFAKQFAMEPLRTRSDHGAHGISAHHTDDGDNDGRTAAGANRSRRRKETRNKVRTLYRMKTNSLWICGWTRLHFCRGPFDLRHTAFHTSQKTYALRKIFSPLWMVSV